jgi:flagellar hook-associated protein 3 FlgL
MTRVPEFLIFNKSQDSISRVRNKLMSNQEEAVSGKRVNRTSDDPVSAMRGMGLKSQSQREDQIGQNLELAQSLVNITDSSLGELTEILSRAKELALQMSSTSNANDDARKATQAEVDQLRLRAVQVGNSRLGDRYLFGGFATDRPPFDQDGNYFGDAGRTELEIDRGQRLVVNLPGLVPFYGISDLPDRPNADFEKGAPRPVTVPGAARSPAFVADQKGVDRDPADPEFQAIQATTGVNVFGVLKDFSQALDRNDIRGVQNTIEGLDTSFRQVLQARAMMGARQNSLKLSAQGVELSQETNADLISKSEDADMLRVYSDVAKNENSLKASLEMNKKILTPSLLQFLS